MTTFVPVIGLVPERVATRLDEMAEDPAVVVALEPLREIMERNGWTPAMMLAGTMIRVGVDAS